MPLLDNEAQQSLSDEVLSYCDSSGFTVEEDAFGANAYLTNEEGHSVAVSIDYDNDSVVVEYGIITEDREEWDRKEFSGDDGVSLDTVKRYML